MKLYYNNKLINPNTWLPVSDLSLLQVDWDYSISDYYTFTIYDIDAPNPQNPSTSPFLHALIINIPGGNIDKGTSLVTYMLPNPSLGQHRYMIDVYRQSAIMSRQNISKRENFDLSGFVSKNQLQLVGSETIVVDSITKNFYLLSSESTSVTFNPNHQLIIGNTTLSDAEQRFCSCTIEVAEKQPGACNLEKAWFEERDHHMCYNPFSVCAHSIGTTSRACKENFNFSQFTPRQMEAYNSLYK